MFLDYLDAIVPFLTILDRIAISVVRSIYLRPESIAHTSLVN